MLQSIIVPKNKFSKKEAIEWVINHKFHIYKIDTTDRFYRFRQKEPRPHGQYYTISLKNGIELIHEKNF